MAVEDHRKPFKDVAALNRMLNTRKRKRTNTQGYLCLNGPLAGESIVLTKQQGTARTLSMSINSQTGYYTEKMIADTQNRRIAETMKGSGNIDNCLFWEVNQ